MLKKVIAHKYSVWDLQVVEAALKEVRFWIKSDPSSLN